MSDAPYFKSFRWNRASPAAVVTGLPGEGSTLLQKLWVRFEDEVDFYVVDHEGELRPVTLADQAEVLKRA